MFIVSLLLYHILVICDAGAQSKTFGNTAFGISASGVQLWGSRVPPYTTTTEPDNYVGLETRGDLQSISAMPIYRDKTHEELRWQDYQLGDRGIFNLRNFL